MGYKILKGNREEFIHLERLKPTFMAAEEACQTGNSAETPLKQQLSSTSQVIDPSSSESTQSRRAPIVTRSGRTGVSIQDTV
ncbi:hypothetical protein JTE90_020551 [Oedothorax gibbosus]|uniref:Uncharacterized protein n=1 Tax=Oedothorax gibbosus TaxID=931172 RepID=A0AAV6VYV3_9ARAC|nr:hypothetical protein JTE90_020551 [Oedothorax gibbosus]